MNNSFLDHYKNKNFGTQTNSIIQVVRNAPTKRSNDIILNYCSNTLKQPSQIGDKVNEFTKLMLARQTANNIKVNKAPILAP